MIAFAVIPTVTFNVQNVWKVVKSRKGSMLLALAMLYPFAVLMGGILAWDYLSPIDLIGRYPPLVVVGTGLPFGFLVKSGRAAFLISFPSLCRPIMVTYYGEPYDGNTRFFKSTLFVAAVRSCYGESCFLHGVDWMPPKGGITEEQLLMFMGANTHLSPLQGKTLLEDEDVGFAYVSQREVHPSLRIPSQFYTGCERWDLGFEPTDTPRTDRSVRL